MTIKHWLTILLLTAPCCNAFNPLLLDRRGFATTSAGLVTSGFFKFLFFKEKGVDYKDVAADITKMIKEDPNKGPTLVRLAWHSSGTYDKMSKTGGSEPGTIFFKEELAHGGNAGLAETAVAWMEPIKQKYGDELSYADLYTLGGGVFGSSIEMNSSSYF